MLQGRRLYSLRTALLSHSSTQSAIQPSSLQARLGSMALHMRVNNVMLYYCLPMLHSACCVGHKKIPAMHMARGNTIAH